MRHDITKRCFDQKSQKRKRLAQDAKHKIQTKIKRIEKASVGDEPRRNR
jgi:hypothetical protein